MHIEAKVQFYEIRHLVTRSLLVLWNKGVVPATAENRPVIFVQVLCHSSIWVLAHPNTASSNASSAFPHFSISFQILLPRPAATRSLFQTPCTHTTFSTSPSYLVSLIGPASFSVFVSPGNYQIDILAKIFSILSTHQNSRNKLKIYLRYIYHTCMSHLYRLVFAYIPLPEQVATQH